MSLSRLFSILVAFALLFAPLAMNHAMAAAPASDHAQMARDAHCPPATNSNHEKAMAKPCCAAMCAAATIVAPASSSEPLFAQLPAHSLTVRFPRGILSEIATPPPRRA